jgi:selenide, water dikinase
VPAINDPRVLVDAATQDDAAVFQVAPDRALVASVDFFSPIVDDAYAFGRIAAANALSDLYAMGARPRFALNLVAWPRAPELLALLGETLRGGADMAREAGVLILGGHSIDDPEPKYGMVAIGEAHPDRLLLNRGAKPGDLIVLTKPIGTGILATGLKRDLLTEADMAEAVGWMTMLNAGGMEAALELGGAVHACTDVTGFGLIGHLRNVLDASGVGARLDAGRVPLLARAHELATGGVIPGGTTRNREAANGHTTWGAGVDEATRTLLCDAQTSGGLLLCIDPTSEVRFDQELAARSGAGGWTVGVVTRGPAGAVEVA